MNNDVEIKFDAYISELFKEKNEIKMFLLRHERKPKVIQSICEQIRLAELSNIRARFDINKYSTVITECAKMFANAALTHAKEQAMSHAEKMRRIDEANRMSQIEAEFEEDQREFESTKLTSRPGSVAN